MDLNYSELKLQSYFTLPGITVEEVRNMFNFRVRMSQFGENFRGDRDRVPCPLCNIHLDNQPMSLECPVLKEKINMEYNMSITNSENVTLQAAQSVTKMLKTRKKLIDQQKPK